MVEPVSSRGKVVGIGKLKVFPSKELRYEIPMLSFLVIKIAEDSYVSSCIQVHMDGYGETQTEAMDNMRENCIEFLKENFGNPKCNKSAWENLHGLFQCGKINNELWNAYRDFQLNLAEKGICTDISLAMKNRIDELERQVKELKKAAQNPNRIVAKIVDYQEFKDAA